MDRFERVIRDGAALVVLTLATSGCTKIHGRKSESTGSTGGGGGSLTIHVSPAGKDSGAGSAELPFRTLARALTAAREVKTRLSTSKGDVTIALEGGNYPIDQPIVLGPEDSGPPGGLLRIVAASPLPPVLGGGHSIRGWRHVANASPHLFSAPAGGYRFRTLFIGERAGTRARFPPLGPSPVLRDAIGYKEARIATAVHLALTDPSAGARMRKTELVLPKSWTLSKIPLSGFEVNLAAPNEAVLKLDNIGGFLEHCTVKEFHFCRIFDILGNSLFNKQLSAPHGTPQEFWFENNLGFVTENEDWYLDEESDEVFLHLANVASPGEVEALDIRVPKGLKSGDNETLLRIEGTDRAPVERVSIEGLWFAHTNWLHPSDQAYVSASSSYLTLDYPHGADKPTLTWRLPPAAVTLNHTRGVRFIGNAFLQLGAGAILGPQGSANTEVLIERNLFHQIASDAVSFTGGGAITIRDNHFYDIGMSYLGHAALFGGANEVVLERNHVSRVGLGAFTLMGFGAASGYFVRENWIENTGLMCHDCGGIYFNTLPEKSDPVGIVENNRLHDLRAPLWIRGADAAPWLGPLGEPLTLNFGIYLDFQSRGLLVRNNSLTGVRKPFNLNCESGNVVTGNVFDTRPEISTGVEIPGGVLRGCGGNTPAQGVPSQTSNNVLTQNVPEFPAASRPRLKGDENWSPLLLRP